MGEAHPLIAGGQQRGNGVAEPQEGGPLLWFAVPALYHHVIPEKAKTGLDIMAEWTAGPAPHGLDSCPLLYITTTALK